MDSGSPKDAKNEFVIVDLETTGLSAERHRITEIAAVKVRSGVIVDKFESLVNPGVPIPRHITRITGIDDDTVKDAPPVKDVLASFLRFAGDSTIVAHNANFDMGFLRYNAAKDLKMSVLNPSLCTKELSKQMVPEMSSRALSSLCAFFGIVNENAHRAMGDVKATFQIFNLLQDRMKENSEETASQHVELPN